MRGRVALSGACLALATLVAPALRAQEVGASHEGAKAASADGVASGAPVQPAVDALFDAALKRKALGETREACEMFEASVSASPAPHAWLQVGLCREPADPVGALTAFEAALGAARLVADPRRREAYERAARERIEPLAQRVPTVTFRKSPTGGVLAEMTGAGREAGSPVDGYDEPLRFNPGRYRLRAWATGFSSYVQELELIDGERRVIVLPPLSPTEPGLPSEASVAPVVPFVPEPLARSAVDTAAGPVFNTLPVTLSVGGVVLVLSGIVAGQVSAAERRELEQGCQLPNGTGQRRCSSGLADTKHRMDDYAVVADVLWVSGALLAGAGITLFILDQDREASPELTAGCLPGSCGVTVAGQF
jgi:hypothetical protein